MDEMNQAAGGSEQQKSNWWTRLRNWWTKLDTNARASHPELWKLFMFVIAGFIANVPELAAYMGMLNGFRALNVTNLGIFEFMRHIVLPKADYPLATVVYAYMISTAFGYAIAFVVNRKATFKADSNVALSTSIYVIVVIFTIFANGIIGPNISSLVGHLPLSKTLAEIISKFLCMLVPGLWVYPMNRFVIHRVKKEKVTDEAA